MHGNHPKEDDKLISLADIFAICKRQKFKIVNSMVFFAFLCLFFALISPVQYVAKGSFKEKSNSSGGISQSLTAGNFFVGTSLGGSKGSETISLMKSKKLLERVIKILGLQASIEKRQFQIPYLNTIKDNIKVEHAYFKNRLGPVLEDPNQSLMITDVQYEGELPIGLKLLFFGDDDYQVMKDQEQIGNGKIGIPFQRPDFSFVILHTDSNSLKGNEFIVNILPLGAVVDIISKRLIVESDKFDKNLLNIKFTHREREIAVKVVNTLMTVYQNYLSEEQGRVAGEQINYLQKRQDEIGSKLKSMMEAYALNISSDMSTTGFSDSNRAMEYLAGIQNHYKNKLLEIDFEVKRLQNAQKEGYGYYENYTSRGDSLVINKLLNEIRDLKQYRDTIDLALRNFSDEENFISHTLFNEQVQRLDEIRKCQTEIQSILVDLKDQKLPMAPQMLADGSKYVAQNWHGVLSEKKIAWEKAPVELKAEKLNEFTACQDHYFTYLKNLQNLFNVHEKIIEERLAHQQGLQAEFQGMDIESARDLYVRLKIQFNEVETEIRQHQFIVDQMQDPHFEYSSLSQVLKDRVSEEMILQTSRLTLALKDENNRSQREQERLNAEIQLQKSFLLIHLKQMVELLKLKQMVLKEKIKMLQNEMLGVVQQKISILEKHIEDYIIIRLKDLKQEQMIIQQYQQDLKKEMGDLPKKWVAEKLIDLQMNMNQHMVEDVTTFVESKNISHNLETIQSAPVDKAFLPIHPLRPHLILFFVVGAVLGTLLSISFFVFKEVFRGLSVTRTNLIAAHQHVSGNLSKRCNKDFFEHPSDADMETLRKVIGFLDESDFVYGGQSLLIIQGQGEDYSKALCKLLAKSCKKVLLMSVSFDAPVPSDQVPGLLQFLEGEAEEPVIQSEEYFDYLSSGGVSRLGTELIGSPAFTGLLDKLRSQYDWVVAISSAMPATVQAQRLIKYFDLVAVTLKEERIIDVNEYFKSQKVTFVFQE